MRMPQLIRFWLPLQATWLMMAVEGPFLAAIIARLPNPKFNLAAYGVAYALALIVEAPVIMMMSAATALVDSRANYQRLRNFMWMLNIGISAIMVLLLFTPLWDLLISRAMHLDPGVAHLVHTAMLILLPWPAAIGYRRFYQGLLIRAGLTRRVAWGTGMRLLTMATVSWNLWHRTELAGAWVGAAALSAGVLIEAVASRIMVRSTVAAIKRDNTDKTPALSLPDIWHFYLPLALTSTISLSVQPMVTFFMGQARYPLESLAVLPVVNSLVFVFRTPGLSFQEVAITVLGRSRDHHPLVRRFATNMGLVAVAGLSLIAYTPLAHLWLEHLSGLSAELAAFALLPLRILAPMPALSMWLSWQRSQCVVTRHTGPITWASTLEIGTILVALVATVQGGHWIGITAAASAFMVGRLASNLYLVGRTG